MCESLEMARLAGEALDASLEMAKRAATALDASHLALKRANTLFRLIDRAIVERHMPEFDDAGNLAEIGLQLTAAIADQLDADVEYFTGVSHG